MQFSPLDRLFEMTYELVMPDLGATGTEIVISEWLVKPDEFVRAGSPVFTVTTDKAEMEVEAFTDGYIRQILISAGSAATPGTVVALIADSREESLPPGPATAVPALGETSARAEPAVQMTERARTAPMPQVRSASEH